MRFAFRYAGEELRRRLGRTLLTSLGLAAGVSLVVAIIGVGQGLDAAETAVLSPLSSVGTDILVTRVVGAQPDSGSAATPAASQAPQQGQGGLGGGGGPGLGGGGFGGGGPGGGGFFGGGGGAAGVNQQDSLALLNENRSVVTDLAKLGKPGDKFIHDFFLPATLLTFPDTALSEVAKLPGVREAAGGLSVLATHQTGTVPEIVAEIQTGGETLNQTVIPDPMTDAEQQAFRTCVSAQGGFGGQRPSGAAQAPAAGDQPAPGPGGGDGPGRGAFESCLPERFRQFRATFITPLRTLRQVVNPPTTDITSTSYTAAGVDTSHPGQGLITRGQITKGAYFSKDPTGQVVLSVAYANKSNLSVGSDIPINGTTFKVVGLVAPTLSGNTSDIYLPLTTLQDMAGKKGRVNMLLVKATDSAGVPKLAKAVAKTLPGAQVVTTKALADQVTGSLADAKSLTDRFGKALAIIVLAGAFIIAILLTLSAVAKRVREIGTLRAIGWTKKMIVRQLLLETIAIGALGGLIGVGLGIGVGAAIAHYSPVLTAFSSGVPGLGSSSLSRFFSTPGAASAATGTASRIHLNVPVHPATAAIGAGFALMGGILAGTIGGWRAARLQPAVALRDLG